MSEEVMEQSTARQAYAVWIMSFYGVYPAVNIKLWEQLPKKTQKAWQDVVVFVQSVKDEK